MMTLDSDALSSQSSLERSSRGPVIRVGYLGPLGSHSHQAALSLLRLFAWSVDIELVPFPSLRALMRATEAKDISLALLPYENALEGSVIEVLETLGDAQRSIRVWAEFLQPVAHCLIQKQPGEQVTRVLSHPMASSQCRETLAGLFGDKLEIQATTSTSEAVRLLNEMEDATGVAAIANRVAADLFRLPVVKTDISDIPENITRFFLVSAKGPWPESIAPPRTDGLIKSSLCIKLPEYPGVLMECLQIFRKHQVNLSKLESRPTRKKYGDYRFFIDCEADIFAASEGQLYEELKAFAIDIVCQGPYPSLGRPPQVFNGEPSKLSVQSKA